MKQFFQSQLNYQAARNKQYNQQRFIEENVQSRLSISAREPENENVKLFFARESLKLRSMRIGVSIKDFSILKQIGRGAYSTVYLVRHKNSNQLLALKKISKRRIGSQIGVRTERACMLNFKSSFIVQLHYVFQDNSNLYFAMDYAPGGDLTHLLDTMGAVPESWARIYCCQMLCAVLTLHGINVNEILKIDELPKRRLTEQNFEESADFSQQLSNFSTEQISNISSSKLKKKNLKIDVNLQVQKFDAFVHRDLKPQNFLIKENGQLMLADFGFATEIDDGKSTMFQSMANIRSNYKIVGTMQYISPEQIKEGAYGKLIDYWALGCIFYEIMTGQVAFNTENIDEYVEKIRSTNYEDIKPDQSEMWNSLSEDAQDLINGLLAPPDQRFGRKHTMYALITHRFFTRNQSVQSILKMENQIFYKMNKQQLDFEDYSEIPILPIESFLNKIQSPWCPPLLNEEDLTYYEKQEQQISESSKQIEFLEESDVCDLSLSFRLQKSDDIVGIGYVDNIWNGSDLLKKAMEMRENDQQSGDQDDDDIEQMLLCQTARVQEKSKIFWK